MTEAVGQSGLTAQSTGKANLVSLNRALGLIYKYCKRAKFLRIVMAEGETTNPKAVPALLEEIL